jgi:hypothetical protein
MQDMPLPAQDHFNPGIQMQINQRMHWRIATIQLPPVNWLTINNEVHPIQALWLFVSAHFVSVCV